jgi:hypothetical protein
MATKTIRQYINQLEQIAKQLGDETPVVYKCRYQFIGTDIAYKPALKPKIINKLTSPKIVVNPNTSAGDL